MLGSASRAPWGNLLGFMSLFKGSEVGLSFNSIPPPLQNLKISVEDDELYPQPRFWHEKEEERGGMASFDGNCRSCGEVLWLWSWTSWLSWFPERLEKHCSSFFSVDCCGPNNDGRIDILPSGVLSMLQVSVVYWRWWAIHFGWLVYSVLVSGIVSHSSITDRLCVKSAHNCLQTWWIILSPVIYQACSKLAKTTWICG